MGAIAKGRGRRSRASADGSSRFHVELMLTSARRARDGHGADLVRPHASTREDPYRLAVGLIGAEASSACSRAGALRPGRSRRSALPRPPRRGARPDGGRARSGRPRFQLSCCGWPATSAPRQWPMRRLRPSRLLRTGRRNRLPGCRSHRGDRALAGRAADRVPASSCPSPTRAASSSPFAAPGDLGASRVVRVPRGFRLRRSRREGGAEHPRSRSRL